MEKMDGMSMDVEKENIKIMKELFPNIVTDGKIDFEMLRNILGDEVDDSKEKYQFTWNGKADSIKIAQTPSSATLRPCREKSKDWDTTENLYIEGDNLEVLKQLQKTYYGKIKMIYIDPPYNTGNDFVYKDDFKESVENYKKQTKQTQKTNVETSGRFHADWLNMMYPRLVLARNLLTDDGVILISIDDCEQDHLRFICDEIFGRDNFIDTLIWKKRYGGGAKERHFVSLHEYVLVYCKSIDRIGELFVPLSSESAERYYSKRDEKYALRGGYRTHPLEAGKAMDSRPNLIYGIPAPDGSIIMPKRQWLWSKERAFEALKNNELEITKGKEGWVVSSKQYLRDEEGNTRPAKMLSIIDDVYTQHGTNEMIKIMGNAKIFPYPKPSEFIKRLVSVITEPDGCFVLDFFSGSAATAHAVMSLNAEDGGRRKFIMVQLPEKCDSESEAYKAGYGTICEIGEERIRRTGESIREEWQKKEENKGLLAETECPIDIGFKVFELDSTNINPWDNSKELDEKTLFDTAAVFKSDRSKEDILYEIMLKYGVFDQPTSEVDVNGKIMYRVGRRHMIVCLEDNIEDNDITEICMLEPRVVVFKEDGFKDDNAKINAEYNLKKAGVEDVKCI